MFSNLAAKIRLSRDHALLGCILIISLCLNLYGIRWGLPSEARTKLYFSGPEVLTEMVESTKKVDLKINNLEMRDVRNAISTLHPDEVYFLYVLSNMKPEKLDFNIHEFSYGTLHIYLFALILKIASIFNLIILTPSFQFYLFNPQELAKIYLIGRLMTVTMSVVTVWLTYILGKRLFSHKKIGLFSALLLAVSPAWVENSHYLKVTIPVTFWIVLAFIFSTQIYNFSKIIWYICAGAAAGFAAGTSYEGAIVLLVVFIAHVILILSDKAARESRFREIFLDRRIIIAILTAICAFFMSCPYSLLAFDEFIKSITSYHIIGGRIPNSTPNFATMLQSWKNPFISLLFGIGWPLLIFVFLGLIYAVLKRSKFDILLLSWIVPYYFILIIWPFHSRTLRHTILLLPFLIILAVRFIMQGIPQSRIQGLRKGITLLILLTLVISGATVSLVRDSWMANMDTQLTTGEYIRDNIQPGSRIGLLSSPWFDTPPIDRQKYKVLILGVDPEEAVFKADYMVVNYNKILGETVNELYSKYDYHQDKRFENQPSTDWFSFWSKDVPHDWMYIDYAFLILENKGEGSLR